MRINKKYLLLSCLIISSHTYAVTVFEDETTKVDIGGAVLFDYFKPVHFRDSFFNASRSTIGASIEHQLKDGWSSDVKFEWDTIVNPPSNTFGNQNGDKFRSRLGYVTIKNDDFGSFRIGKQYSAYHDVAGYMDNLIVFDPDATPLFSDGKDGGFMATARGDNLIVYRNSFDTLNISIQYGMNNVENQALTLKRDSNFAIAASYDFDIGLSFGVTHMQNKVEGSSTSFIDTGIKDGDSQEITTFAIKYNYSGLKVTSAFTYGKKAHETDLLGYGFDGIAPTGKANLYADASAYDLYAHYYFDIGLRPYVYFSSVNFDDNTISNDGERNIYSLGLSYHATSQLILSGEVRKIEEDNLGAGDQSDTLTGVTLIYSF